MVIWQVNPNVRLNDFPVTADEVELSPAADFENDAVTDRIKVLVFRRVSELQGDTAVRRENLRILAIRFGRVDLSSLRLFADWLLTRHYADTQPCGATRKNADLAEVLLLLLLH